jgi:acyl carrier protein
MTTLDTLQDILVRDYNLERARLAPDALLSTLGLDSLSLLELMFKIEDDFHVKIPGDTPTNLMSIQDVVVYIDGLIASQPATIQPEGGPPEAGTPAAGQPEPPPPSQGARAIT